VLMRWFDPAGWLSLAAEHRVARSSVVPSMLTMIMAQPVEDHDLSELRYIGSGGAPLAVDLAERVEKRLGVEVLEGYGCTESSAVISSTPPGRRKLGTVGRPLPGLDVQVLDPSTGEPVGPGQDGEITVAGPGVMVGYWHSPDATAFAVRDGRLHTGDIGHLDGDGYLCVVDRIKDLIIRGGFNVYPRDVEDALTLHPAVALAAVVGRPDPHSGEEVVAYVQLAPGAEVTVDELMAHAKATLSAVKYPREIHILDTLPLTSVGKLDRKALRSS
jgi:long-chain acyl-CoA synthetase